MSHNLRLGVLGGLAAVAAATTALLAGLTASPGRAASGNAADSEAHRRAEAAARDWSERPCVPGWDGRTQAMVVCGWRGELPAGAGFAAVWLRDVPVGTPRPRLLPQAGPGTDPSEAAADTAHDVVVAWPATSPVTAARGGFSAPAAMVGLFGAAAAAALAAGAGAAWRARQRRVAPSLPVQASPTHGPGMPVPPPLSFAAVPRRKGSDPLVFAAIEVRDVVPSAALASRLGEGLTGHGVEQVDPAGQPFDPATQTAIATLPTDDPRREGMVAHTDRLGYRSGGRILRQAQVTVFRQRGRTS